ncbi:transglutaminase domain-containing protein [Aridibaculum aurantiacum]|uniref:transglutaminase domain-containing protein n=1 Tax=Aridibaculum aurantiacum TaxID=2810307 RepID=UPI001A9641A4|nr:transglutaminase domain-containing protein [Aridibaculum aurantiacum]
MLQRFLLLLFVVFTGVVVTAQDYAYPAVNYNSPALETSPVLLATRLTAHAKTDRQKVEAIFRWITDNIDYKVQPTVISRRMPLRAAYSSDADTGALKNVNERVSEKVLQDKEAFCEGYARLFSTLCSYAGIRSEVVTGYVRNGIDRPAKNFRSNHSWNAVMIDSSWHLLDVTWASGYVTFGGNRFIRQYDDYYYLPKPEEFIRTHYPEDLQWTLLPDPPTLKEYNASPFKSTGLYTRHVKSFYPSWGSLNAAVGDTLHFEIEVEDPSNDLRVVDVLQLDSVILSQVNWWEHPKQQVKRIGNKIRCDYIVPEHPVKWLHLIYNDAVILRYRLVVEKEETTKSQTHNLLKE